MKHLLAALVAALLLAGCSAEKHEHPKKHGPHMNFSMSKGDKPGEYVMDNPREKVVACEAHIKHQTVFLCERSEGTTYYHILFPAKADDAAYKHVLEHAAKATSDRPVRLYFYENRAEYESDGMHAVGTVFEDGRYVVGFYDGGDVLRGQLS